MQKALREIRRLTTTIACDMIDILEHGCMRRTEEETVESIQARLQAILRNVDEALVETNDA